MWRESSVVADIRSNFSISIFSRILHFVKNVSLILKQVQNDTSKIPRNARPRIETSSWFWEPIILLSLDRAIIPPSDVWWTPERNSAPAPEHCNQFYSLRSIPVMLKCLCCRFRGSASPRKLAQTRNRYFGRSLFRDEYLWNKESREDCYLENF